MFTDLGVLPHLRLCEWSNIWTEFVKTVTSSTEIQIYTRCAGNTSFRPYTLGCTEVWSFSATLAVVENRLYEEARK